jgi:hypothetical protein
MTCLSAALASETKPLVRLMEGEVWRMKQRMTKGRVIGGVVVAVALLGGLALYFQLTAMTYATLTDRLRAAGAKVAAGDVVQQPFLSVPGRILSVNGEDVQVYEYGNPIAAYLDAMQVSHDGSTVGGSTIIEWIDTPHFYKQGRVIAIYVGHTARMTHLLSGALGAQFAGG